MSRPAALAAGRSPQHDPLPGFDRVPVTASFWPPARDSLPLPYCSDGQKFAPAGARALASRFEVRQQHGIGQTAKLVLSVIKLLFPFYGGCMAMKVVFVQTNPSQLDAPFYQRLSETLPGETLVLFWNDFGAVRSRIDPELGVVPQFPDSYEYPSLWVDKRTRGLLALWRAIVKQRPRLALFQDQSWLERIVLSVLLRLSGVAVGLRSDKNCFSETARSGWGRRLEGLFVRKCFNVLAPVSALTSSYYFWPPTRDSMLLPYCSDGEKFSPTGARALASRLEVRQRFGIAETAKLFLSVIKFAEREDPRTVIEAFGVLSEQVPDAWLIMVGSGPLLEREMAWVAQRNIANVRFTGYIPYANLEQYFFAADVLVHLPKVGPWEVSVPDALLAGKGVIATDVVGSARLLLTGELTKYLVEVGDVNGTARRMRELCTIVDTEALFGPAKASASECFSVSATARHWASWLQGLEARVLS